MLHLREKAKDTMNWLKSAKILEPGVRGFIGTRVHLLLRCLGTSCKGKKIFFEEIMRSHRESESLFQG